MGGLAGTCSAGGATAGFGEPVFGGIVIGPEEGLGSLPGALLAGVVRRDSASSYANAAVLRVAGQPDQFADKRRLALIAEATEVILDRLTT